MPETYSESFLFLQICFWRLSFYLIVFFTNRTCEGSSQRLLFGNNIRGTQHRHGWAENECRRVSQGTRNQQGLVTLKGCGHKWTNRNPLRICSRPIRARSKNLLWSAGKRSGISEWLMKQHFSRHSLDETGCMSEAIAMICYISSWCNLFLGQSKKKWQKKIEAKTYQILSEVMGSLARMAAKKLWMGESYENQDIFWKLASKPLGDRNFIQHLRKNTPIA